MLVMYSEIPHLKHISKYELKSIVHLFDIPNNPQEQLALVKNLGPQLYKKWKI